MTDVSEEDQFLTNDHLIEPVNGPDTVQLDNGPVGIGGWLIVVIIGLVVTILWTGFNVVTTFTGESLEGIKFIYLNEFEGRTSFIIMIFMSALGGMLVISSAFLVLYFMFRRNHNVRNFAIIHYSILAAVGISEALIYQYAHSNFPDSFPVDLQYANEAIRGIVILVVWGAYFGVSKRVKNTFG